MDDSDSYILGRSDSETRRLILQHQVYGSISRRMFEAAGIGRGMRILDLGSGAGDVALLLADLVGPEGRVHGVEMNAVILDTARSRAEAAGWRNVSFQAGDLVEADPGWTPDAVVGRWILMYQGDPVATLRTFAGRVRPGGVLAFQEVDFHNPPAILPPSPLSERVHQWVVPPPDVTGPPETRMGSKLFRVYLDAGLPAPELRLEAPIGGGPDWPGYELMAETARSLLPTLEQRAGLDPAELDVDTLAERLREDAVSGRRVQTLPMLVGAWART